MCNKLAFLLLVVLFAAALVVVSSFVCLDAIPVLQCRSSGVLIDEGVLYARADPIPGHGFRFSHWAGGTYFDQELDSIARIACYSTIDGGLGCDIRYVPSR
ncbi:hypothetical protein GTO10_05900 [Candidatus Saccharibacteria bacterium]|nr:hypothetical protein [Candidatus Saccharibacteria bacterium]